MGPTINFSLFFFVMKIEIIKLSPPKNKTDNVCEVWIRVAKMVKIRQGLFNLLSNACKFTRQGTVSLCAKRVGDPSGEGHPTDLELRTSRIRPPSGVSSEPRRQLLNCESGCTGATRYRFLIQTLQLSPISSRA